MDSATEYCRLTSTCTGLAELAAIEAPLSKLSVARTTCSEQRSVLIVSSSTTSRTLAICVAMSGERRRARLEVMEFGRYADLGSSAAYSLTSRVYYAKLEDHVCMSAESVSTGCCEFSMMLVWVPADALIQPSRDSQYSGCAAQTSQCDIEQPTTFDQPIHLVNSEGGTRGGTERKSHLRLEGSKAGQR